MQVGDTVKITGEDGSYVEVGRDDEYPGGIFVGVLDGTGAVQQEVSLSSSESVLLLTALNLIVRGRA